MFSLKTRGRKTFAAEQKIMELKKNYLKKEKNRKKIR